MIDNAVVTVGTEATLLTVGVDENSDVDRSIALRNVGAVDVALGGADVAMDNGWLLEPDGEISFDITAGDLLYGRVAVGTADVRVLQTGL
jgi:hypothetical protein